MRRCHRQLMFTQIVASHNARDVERREAFILKQLQYINTWQGSLIHEVLASSIPVALQTSRKINVEEMSLKAKELAMRQFAFSKAKLYRASGQTKSAAGDAFCALAEHEFDIPISQATVDRVFDAIKLCFDNLASQREFLQLLETGSRHKTEINMPFKLNGFTISANPDLFFISVRGKKIIVDWKIAESETSDYSKQLIVYGLALLSNGWWPDISATDIELYEVNLLKNYVRKHPFDADRVNEAEDFIFASTAEMTGLIGDIKYNDLESNEFEPANSPLTCAFCNFRPLCIQWLEKKGQSIENIFAVEKLLKTNSNDLAGTTNMIQGSLL